MSLLSSSLCQAATLSFHERKLFSILLGLSCFCRWNFSIFFCSQDQKSIKLASLALLQILYFNGWNGAFRFSVQICLNVGLTSEKINNWLNSQHRTSVISHHIWMEELGLFCAVTIFMKIYRVFRIMTNIIIIRIFNENMFRSDVICKQNCIDEISIYLLLIFLKRGIKKNSTIGQFSFLWTQIVLFEWTAFRLISASHISGKTVFRLIIFSFSCFSFSYISCININCSVQHPQNKIISAPLDTEITFR